MNDIVEMVAARKGQIVTLDIERPVKIRKGCRPIVKQSTIQARAGVNYENIQAVKEKRANGELPSENAGLPYGQWVIPNVLLEHNGQRYLRFTTFNGKMKVAPKYLRDGKELSIDIVKAEALASEFADREDLDVFNLKVENIKAVR